ncbi:pimeloyl-ACP methyl ester esterase BioH [Wenzhouxiangella sp. XN24]|uniref:pimeloyl-ACP methyl ester esterase BioH n=1 Tax=Wenzhouxiangella sp. XN24 TaxID=2713569 RepID=UPI0013EA1841|nr:pimeloyl-ACP methyl ester esterase BioH [Wenzhouxiangella sp. XN24]NGX17464.1 pimeloyl-ACP methyl ester esterase BioH [Wenzhouxiangella sp. XN24]
MKLHAQTAGHGPDLVLLHGWGLHSGIWAPLLPGLVPHCRVTCIDLPGHGLSPRDRADFTVEAAVAAVAAAAPPGATWLGWSLGGQLAVAAALAGHAIDRLVLVATTPRFVTAPDWPCAMANTTLADFAAALDRDHQKTVRDFLALQLRGDRQAATRLAELRRLLAGSDEPDPRALAAGLTILATLDLRTRLEEVRQPTLVIAGERDRLTPAEAGRRLATALPDGRLLVMPGAAHAPFLACPDDFVAAVTAFLPGAQAA